MARAKAKAATDMTNLAELRERVEELEAENATLQEQLASSQNENEFLIKNAAEEI